MKNATKFLTLFALILLTAACTTVNSPKIGQDEIATKLGATDCTEVTTAPVQYTNFCTYKNCEGAPLKYSKLMREVAVLTQAISALDASAFATLVEETTPGELVLAGNEELPILRSELKTLTATVDALSPETDFANSPNQKHAIGSVQLAVQKLKHAAIRLERAETNVAMLMNEEPILVSWEPETSVPSESFVAGLNTEPVSPSLSVRAFTILMAKLPRFGQTQEQDQIQ